jgi:hypothetical protein
MILHQVLPLPLQPVGTFHIVQLPGINIAINDGTCTSKKTSFVPLRATASFPDQAAGVAELSSAAAC